ncbi:MAG: archaeosortase/exosortase family protein [Candidatus Woesearchaeota archaeon]
MQKNFKIFLKTSIFFIIFVLSISLFIQVYFSKTEFYKNYLTIPKDFSIEPPNFRTNFISGLFIGFIAFLILSYDKLKNIKQPKTSFKLFILPVVFIISQYLLKYTISQNLDFFLQSPKLWGFLRFFINLLFVSSTALAFYGIDFIKYFFKKFKKEVFIFFTLSILFFFIILLFQNLWLFLSSLISKILYVFFKLFFKDIIYQEFVSVSSMSEGGGPLLGIKNFSAVIGKPCSGIDSLLYFSAIFTLIIFVDRKRLKKIPTTIAFILGLIGMFITNMIRILLLFIIGAYLSPNFALGMFHNNIGWILFIVYFYVFFKIARKFIYNN